MPWWEEIFGPDTAPRILGYTSDGRVVSEQRHVVGTMPTAREIKHYLKPMGFHQAYEKFHLWVRRLHSGRVIWLGDARSPNFVKTTEGEVVPIDVRLWEEPAVLA